jgi:hypothetical protein
MPHRGKVVAHDEVCRRIAGKVLARFSRIRARGGAATKQVSLFVFVY